MLLKKGVQVFEILETLQEEKEIFKRILMFMKEMDYHVNDLDVKELSKKK